VTIQVLIAHSRDGIGGSVITGLLLTRARKRAVDWLLHRLTVLVVFVAGTNRPRFRRITKIPHSIIYNGVDLASFQPRSESDSDVVTVGFVSNLVDRKRPEWVIRAAGCLIRNGLDVT